MTTSIGVGATSTSGATGGGPSTTTSATATSTSTASTGAASTSGAGGGEPVSCLDGLKDGDETDIDCGGAVCGPCASGEACLEPGDSSVHFSPIPVQVTGLTSGVIAIASNGARVFAITSGGGVSCWGLGPLGDGTKASSNVPVPIPGLSGVRAITVGAMACALTNAGEVSCWGIDQLTIGAVSFLSPTAVPGFPSVVAQVAAGADQVCVLTTAGGVMCWAGNHQGDLGNGMQAPAHVAVWVDEN